MIHDSGLLFWATLYMASIKATTVYKRFGLKSH